MSTLSQFANSMRQTAKNVDRNSTVLVQRVALRLVTELVQRTPIDTGYAKSNWLISTMGYVEGTRDAFAYGEKGSTRLQNERGAIADAEYKIRQFKIINGNESIFVSNNVDYIVDLEQGKSKAQAPYGFLDMSMIAAAMVIHNSQLLKYNGIAK